ncbi:MAG TPA: hypothetical protein ENN13_00185 [Candidatus Altiarchaeales archaeon]|nr:hypothetical protein [Candidatus Altiarchaeales archaeon]
METGAIVYTSVLLTLLVVIPGVALSLAVFPRKEDLTTPERFGLSILLGLTPALMLYFLDKNFGVLITTASSILAYGGLTLGGLGVWRFRRSQAG